jgi:hypothetical protein
MLEQECLKVWTTFNWLVYGNTIMNVLFHMSRNKGKTIPVTGREGP